VGLNFGATNEASIIAATAPTLSLNASIISMDILNIGGQGNVILEPSSATNYNTLSGSVNLSDSGQVIVGNAWAGFGNGAATVTINSGTLGSNNGTPNFSNPIVLAGPATLGISNTGGLVFFGP